MSLARSTLPKTRTIETAINLEQFKQHFEAFLRSSSFVNDNEDVKKLDFDFKGIKDGKLPFKMTLNKREEVRLIIHNEHR